MNSREVILRKLDRFLFATLLLMVVGVLIVSAYDYKNWVYRYGDILDKFFGEENWSYLGKERELSPHSKVGISGNWKASYTDWLVEYKNRNGEMRSFTISNQGLVARRYFSDYFDLEYLLDGKRSVVADMLDIAFEQLEQELKVEILTQLALDPARYQDYFDLNVSYAGKGRHEGIEKIVKETWFRQSEISLKHLMDYRKDYFYIRFQMTQYYKEDVGEKEWKVWQDRFEKTKQLLFAKFGNEVEMTAELGKSYKEEYQYGLLQRQVEYPKERK